MLLRNNAGVDLQAKPAMCSRIDLLDLIAGHPETQ